MSTRSSLTAEESEGELSKHFPAAAAVAEPNAAPTTNSVSILALLAPFFLKAGLLFSFPARRQLAQGISFQHRPGE